jgi:predicted MPP superfamily phosphohydrolase
MVGLMLSLHVYLGSRLIDGLNLTPTANAAAWATLWTMFGSIFMGFIGGRVLPRTAAKVFQWLGFVWMGAFGVLLTLVATSDLVLFAAGSFTTLDPRWSVARSVVVLGLVAPALVWGFVTARAPAIKRVSVDVPGLHPDLDGFRLIQLSDVHIGETLDRRFSEYIVATVNGLAGDAVVITGDLIDGSVERLRHEVAPLAKLSSRHGTFFVTGNHEYYSGADQWVREVERLGMTVLHNEHHVVTQGAGQLVLGGVPDVQGASFSPSHRPDVLEAFRGAPDAPRVLLAHQPRFASAAKHANISLMLSGHTHGGQIFPFNFFVKLQQPVVSGFHVIEGVPTYTSKGTGYWGPPFRIGARGEVTEITLRAVTGGTTAPRPPTAG